MINIEDKTERLTANLSTLLAQHDLLKVYYAEYGEHIPRGSNVSPCLRIAVPLSGCHRMQIISGGEHVTIRPIPETVTFIPAGHWNRPDWKLPVEVVTFGFMENLTWASYVENPFGSANSRIATRITIARLPNADYELLKLTSLMLSDNADNPRNRLLVKALLYACLELLRSPATMASGKAYHTWQAIITYLEEDHSTSINRKKIAGIFRLTPNYISFLFKQQTNCGFSEYLNKLRCDKACFLLNNYNQTLDEIALTVGFNSTAYFCRIFKRIYNMTPTEYRNRSDKSPFQV